MEENESGDQTLRVIFNRRTPTQKENAVRKLKFVIALSVLALTIASDSQVTQEHVAPPPTAVHTHKPSPR